MTHEDGDNTINRNQVPSATIHPCPEEPYVSSSHLSLAPFIGTQHVESTSFRAFLNDTFMEKSSISRVRLLRLTEGRQRLKKVAQNVLAGEEVVVVEIHNDLSTYIQLPLTFLNYSTTPIQILLQNRN